MKYFTIDEFTRSSKAKSLKIDNSPTPEHLANIEEMVGNLLDPLREAWGAHCREVRLGSPAITISSGYRSEALNSSIKGASRTSAHCFGLAADLIPANREFREFKTFCRRWLINHDFDQMISESEDNNGIPRWIHLGYRRGNGEQRRQYLSNFNGSYFPMTD